ncbi:MAG: 4Fe-4S binding protein [Bacteroidales bacterium]|nr:4Fe-4S binding protein [Bacteroidales bacterium]
MAIITVTEKCTGCESCVKICPQLILEINESLVASPDRSACFFAIHLPIPATHHLKKQSVN